MAYEVEHFIDTSKFVWNFSLFKEEDVLAFRKGNLNNAYDYFGSHEMHLLDTNGFYFAVWAPNATYVSVVGEFNGWKKELHPLYVRLDKSGIWEGFIPRLNAGMNYKYFIKGFEDSENYKADPFARYAELRPATASVLFSSEYKWQDEHWLNHRSEKNSLQSPWSVYELHLASWMRPEKNNEEVYNSYEQIADRLIPYINGMGFTHVEFMPVMEHPFDGSWGYQDTGFFAPTSRYGDPDAFKYLVDSLHKNDIGVILDWVPSHFPNDAHGLYNFDGTHTYEYGDMRKGFHPDWNSYIFNYKRGEVISFLISSAHFWLREFHADGLRVDAVNSIIRLDFSRNAGEWEPNEEGGNENLEAIAFLKQLNKVLYRDFNGIQTIAEEASDWPGITKSLSKKGFGFGMKWMMGWMHDSFKYFKLLPEERKNVQDNFTFSIMYFYDEKFMLPISHDEVVHGKSPMIYKMPGNEWEKFANLRLLYTCMFMHPGAKLLFMGNEFGQTSEWNYKSELDWELLQYEPHNKLQECVRTLCHLYKNNSSLYEWQFDRKGFEWVELNSMDEGIIAFKRKGKHKENDVLVILNISAVNCIRKHLTVKGKAEWKELFNSNELQYWGNGNGMNPHIQTKIVDKKKRLYEIIVDVPSLSAVILQ